MIPQAWKENKPKIMRRGCFFLVVLVFGILQISDVLPTFFGIRFLPLLPLTVVLGMFERETYGLYYGLLAGIMWDMNLGDGVFLCVCRLLLRFADDLSDDEQSHHCKYSLYGQYTALFYSSLDYFCSCKRL